VIEPFTWQDGERTIAFGRGRVAEAQAVLGDRYLLLPRAAGDKVRERDAGMIVLDHGSGSEPAAATSEDDAYYAQFKVPDDLVW